MNFDRLNTFLMAAEDLNFTQAARRLNLSQPAVSQQIRELEESLGVSLFERRGRGLMLTPAGERLQMMAQPILRDVKQVESGKVKTIVREAAAPRSRRQPREMLYRDGLEAIRRQLRTERDRRPESDAAGSVSP